MARWISEINLKVTTEKDMIAKVINACDYSFDIRENVEGYGSVILKNNKICVVLSDYSVDVTDSLKRIHATLQDLLDKLLSIKFNY